MPNSSITPLRTSVSMSIFSASTGFGSSFLAGAYSFSSGAGTFGIIERARAS